MAGACGRIGLVHSSANPFNKKVLGSPCVSDTDIQQCQDRRGPCCHIGSGRKRIDKDPQEQVIHATINAMKNMGRILPQSNGSPFPHGTREGLGM